MVVTTPLTADVERVVHALPEIVRGAAAPRHAASRRLGVPQVRALIRLADAEVLTMGELARQLGISYPAASQIADQLVEVGLALRERPEWDRRVVLLRLTEHAGATVQQVQATRRRQVEEVLERLSPAERAGFVRGVGLLAEILVRDLASETRAASDRLGHGV